MLCVPIVIYSHCYLCTAITFIRINLVALAELFRWWYARNDISMYFYYTHSWRTETKEKKNFMG